MFFDVVADEISVDEIESTSNPANNLIDDVRDHFLEHLESAKVCLDELLNDIIEYIIYRDQTPLRGRRP